MVTHSASDECRHLSGILPLESVLRLGSRIDLLSQHSVSVFLSSLRNKVSLASLSALAPCLCLSVSVSVTVSVSLSVSVCQSVCLSVCLSLSLPPPSLSLSSCLECRSASGSKVFPFQINFAELSGDFCYFFFFSPVSESAILLVYAAKVQTIDFLIWN